MKPSILTRDPTDLPLLGIRRFDGTSIPKALLPPHGRLALTMMGCHPRLEWKNLHQESLSEAEGLRLESISPDSMIYLLPRRRAKIVSIVVGHFLPLGVLNMLFDYSREPRSDIALWIWKFLCSCECVRLGLNPLTTSLCVLSRSDNSAGLIWRAPVFKTSLWEKMSAVATSLPFDLKTRKFNDTSQKQGIANRSSLCASIWILGQGTWLCHPRMPTFRSIWKFRRFFRMQHHDIFLLSINEGFIDLTSSLNFIQIPPSRKEKLDLLLWIQKDLAETGNLLYHRPQQCQSPPLLAKLALDNDNIAEICAQLVL